MPDLPSGTVTLLFTDIEGSTRLWEAHAPAMRAALARHDAILRHCIQEHQGHVFKTGGDAFCAAFHTAAGAFAAALDAQRALQREPWPEDAKLRVRMALHSGAVELRDSDYFGAPLNRVARLLATGHGGQMLLSQATHDLCRDHLPPLASFKSLGVHALKDLGRPESVFQACHPELPHGYPPLKAQGAPRAPDEKESPSIAVLPFVNMSRDEENEYFADGLSEELLNLLAKIRGLRVASRTSAFSFKGKDVDIPSVAQKLNVATVLEGSVRKSGKRVRITAQLIEVASDSHLWSETYDRELDDIFAVQDDIAQSVVKELRTALMGATDESAATAAEAAVRQAATGRSANAEAFQRYLQGRFYGERLTQEDTDRGVALLKEAIAMEPGFALAWAELSRILQLQAGYGFAQINEGYAEARAAALEALRIAPDLPEGHVELGRISQSYDWDWAATDASFKRALALAPGDSNVVRASASLARILGRFEEGFALMEQSIALDPLSANARRQIGMLLLSSGRFDEAAANFEATIDLSHKVGTVRAFLAITRLWQGRQDDAIAIAADETHPVFRYLASAVIHHHRGAVAQCEAALEALTREFAWTAAYQVAEIHAYRGDADQTFAWLEQAYSQKDPGTLMVATDPFFQGMRGDPRWEPFVERLGLGEAARRCAAQLTLG